MSEEPPGDLDPSDVGVVVFKVSKQRLWAGICLITVLVTISLAYWLLVPPMKGLVITQGILEDLGMDGVVLFHRHDRDRDGVLSITEFEPLAHKLLEMKEMYSYDLPISEDDEVLTIKASLQPLKLESLSKDIATVAAEGLDPLSGLKKWRVPHKPWQNFGASHLRLFLPDNPSEQTELCRPYQLIGIPSDLPAGMMFSSNRYNPPHLVDQTDMMVYRLLSLLHPRPFVLTRFAPHGAVACVRAFNHEYVDIVFRIHAEFQLNEPPFPPFWFTPGQLTGHIIIARNATQVLEFHLYIPNHNRLNVDLEWLVGAGKEDMEVDIGYMSELALRSTGPSIAAIRGNQRDVRGLYIEPHPVPALSWDEEISYSDALSRLELKFFPFKKVPYHAFSAAFSLASAAGRLVHSIVLWGALDDQSC